MISHESSVEHFVTLFDSKFLVLGLALNASLQKLSPNAHLWVVCIDDIVEQQLTQLRLTNVHTIPLREIETDSLRSVKSGRTLGEYCWTLTPFAPQAVFDRAPGARRVTYLDSDLFFFSSVEIIFNEFEASHKHVLITEHAYAPELDRTEKSGRFCVQFMIFKRSQEGFEVLNWWQQKCIEWCFDRYEDGKFGDQKYLDLWPELFPNSVHVFLQTDKALAPWNVDYFLNQHDLKLVPVFYHFQSFRVVEANLVRLYVGIKIGRNADRFYQAYVQAIEEQLSFMSKFGISASIMPEPKRKFRSLRNIYMRALGRTRYAKLKSIEHQ